MKAGRKFEQIIERILRLLAPGAEVTSPGQLPDRAMVEPREIDVLVRGKFRDAPVALLIVECRDHKKRVSVGYIESIATKRTDVRADRAFVVSAAGFTKGARQKAKHHAIELFTLEEAELKDWSEWLGIRAVENYSPNVWVYHADITLSPDSPSNIDLSELAVPGKGVNVMAPLFLDVQSHPWTMIELINAAIRHTGMPALSLDGSRRRLNLHLEVSALELGIAGPSGPLGRVTALRVVADFWRERSVHALAGLKFAEVEGDIELDYAESVLHVADNSGRQTVPVRVALTRDDRGVISVLVDGPTDRSSPCAT